ncbi:acyl-CoA thioesterase [Leptospira semungkisensis]|nr:acyl-[acyl-carrier-protein] thioesterase [Leptospira semungkisensis]
MEQTQKTISSLSLPVRRADLDVNGHVNNGTYQSYLEEARLKAFAELKAQNESQILELDRLSIRRCELEYKGELKYPEEARITTEILSSNPESTEIVQEMFRASDSALVTKASFTLGFPGEEKEVFFNEENYPYSFYHQIGVGWAELNPEGVVDLDVIQYYLDDARIRSSYQSGLDIDDLRERGIGPVIYKLELNYFDTMTFPNDYVIVTSYLRTDKNRLAFTHDVFSKSTKKLILSCLAHGLFMDLKRKRPYQFTEAEMEKVFRTKTTPIF